MKYIVFIFTVFVSITFYGQNISPTENYIYSRTYLEPVTSSSSSAKQLQNVSYYDGLGRIKQNVAIQATATTKDLVTPYQYDELGRQLYEFLPIPISTQYGAIQYADPSIAIDYYGESVVYSQKKMDDPSRNRTIEQAAPGSSWAMGNGHTIRQDYNLNNSGEVNKYTVTSYWNASSGLFEPSITNSNEKYNANVLRKNTVYDENGITTIEFYDGLNNLILKRQFIDHTPVDTYYLFDQFNNLCYVLPPLANGSTTDTVLKDLCYQYKHDNKKRLVEKKLPGKQWEFIVYDRLDRIVATGPAFTPFGGPETGWLITKYDGFNRVTYTGWHNSAASRSTLQAQQNATSSNFSEKRAAAHNVDGVTIGYTSVAFPTSSLTILTVNYYDDYNYPNGPSLINEVEGQTILSNVKGLNTGTWIRSLTIGFIAGEQSYTFYDLKARPIRNYSQNIWGGFTQVDSKLNFSGQPEYTKTQHTRADRTTGSVEVNVIDFYTYNNQNLVELHTQEINSGWEQLIARYTYDDLGRVLSKNVGGFNLSGDRGLQKVDYRYNIRGWLTDINNENPNKNSPTLNLGLGDLFGFKINYNHVTVANNGIMQYASESINGAVKPLYNGNIAETLWRTTSDNVLRKYGYQYDPLNRLLDAYYQKPETSNPIPGSYNEKIRYDLNGNITSLKRKGDDDGLIINGNIIDDLVYTYSGNQLTKVFDTSNNPAGFKDNSNGITHPDVDDYAYDLNGNMVRDNNKKISIAYYNHLNLPSDFIFADGSQIGYFYMADGRKIQKFVKEANVLTKTDYLDGFQYVNGLLKFFPHPEGYVNYSLPTEPCIDCRPIPSYNYVFNYTDHLGNVRLSYASEVGQLKILEENHYYPFGLKHTNYNNSLFEWRRKGTEAAKIINAIPLAPIAYNYKYNGKELQNELGLNMYDYGSRLYDPARAGWSNIDPLAEKSRRWSTYVYCYNNPLIFTDPDGMFASPPTDLFNTNGKKIGTDGVDNGVKMVVTDKKEAKQIAKTEGNIDLSTVKSGVTLPSDAALKESLNVLDRHVKGGGLKEESSIVMKDGAVLRGQTGPMPTIVNGSQVAPSTLPALPAGTTPSDAETTIHAHPTTVQQVGSTIYPQSASVPSVGAGSDGPTFQQYNTNIIVGPIGTITSASTNPDGSFTTPYRPNGAVIYDSNSKEKVSLEKSAIEKILKN